MLRWIRKGLTWEQASRDEVVEVQVSAAVSRFKVIFYVQIFDIISNHQPLHCCDLQLPSSPYPILSPSMRHYIFGYLSFSTPLLSFPRQSAISPSPLYTRPVPPKSSLPPPLFKINTIIDVSLCNCVSVQFGSIASVRAAVY